MVEGYICIQKKKSNLSEHFLLWVLFKTLLSTDYCFPFGQPPHYCLRNPHPFITRLSSGSFFLILEHYYSPYSGEWKAHIPQQVAGRTPNKMCGLHNKYRQNKQGKFSACVFRLLYVPAVCVPLRQDKVLVHPLSLS